MRSTLVQIRFSCRLIWTASYGSSMTTNYQCCPRALKNRDSAPFRASGRLTGEAAQFGQHPTPERNLISPLEGYPNGINDLRPRFERSGTIWTAVRKMPLACATRMSLPMIPPRRGSWICFRAPGEGITSLHFGCVSYVEVIFTVAGIAPELLGSRHEVSTWAKVRR